MNTDRIVLVPEWADIELVQSQQRLELLSFDEIVNQVIVGQVLFLQDSQSHPYLLVKEAGSFGFAALFRSAAAECLKKGVSKVVSQDQFYELTLSLHRDYCLVQDHLQNAHPVISLHIRTLAKCTDRFVRDLYKTMVALFPSVAQRHDIDELRLMLGLTYPVR